MLVEDIVEYEGSLCNEGSSSWISINRGSYQSKMVQLVYGEFCSWVGVYLGAAF